MTLINYLTRIHFADGVLEEALRSEMERLGRRRPLIVADRDHIDSGIGDRLYSSFPLRTKVATFSDVPPFVTETAAEAVAELYRGDKCDLLIAYGGNSAIDLAKVARMAIARDEPVSMLVSEEGGLHGAEDDEIPELVAIPDVSGFSSAVSDYTRLTLKSGDQAMFKARRLIPAIAICDPTVTLGSSETAGASAAVGVISRAIDAYLAKGFNPPADGLALDALNRVVMHSDAALDRDELPARREMMAGSLNSSLSLQKGLCALHAITNALASMSDTAIDLGAVSRLVLPELVSSYGDAVAPRDCALKRSLRISKKESLSNGLVEMLRDIPLPQSLSSMGVARDQLPMTAKRASADRAIRNGPRHISESEILSILETIY